jgi:ABC-2 type transport system ATP-binding protein
MCTHLLLEAEGLADQVVMLREGRDVVSGTPGELVRRYWPHPIVLIDAQDRATLDLAAGLDGVVRFERNGAGATLAVDDLARVPDLVAALAAAGVRMTRVVPHEPSLEELYFAVNGREEGEG